MSHATWAGRETGCQGLSKSGPAKIDCRESAASWVMRALSDRCSRVVVLGSFFRFVVSISRVCVRCAAHPGLALRLPHGAPRVSESCKPDCRKLRAPGMSDERRLPPWPAVLRRHFRRVYL